VRKREDTYVYLVLEMEDKDGKKGRGREGRSVYEGR
jgi:hypothetical protein